MIGSTCQTNIDGVVVAFDAVVVGEVANRRWRGCKFLQMLFSLQVFLNIVNDYFRYLSLSSAIMVVKGLCYPDTFCWLNLFIVKTNGQDNRDLVQMRQHLLTKVRC